MPLSDRRRYYAGLDRGRDGHREFDGSRRGRDLNNVDTGVEPHRLVVLFEPEFGGCIRMHLGPAIPDDLADRLRHFLQPRLVGAPPVVKEEMRKRHERQFGSWFSRGLGRLLKNRGVEADRDLLCSLEETTLPPRLIPEVGSRYARSDLRLKVLPRG